MLAEKYFLSIKDSTKNFLFVILVSFAAIFAGSANAETPKNTANSDPVQMVQTTTESMIQLIKNAKTYYEKEPQRFHQEVLTILDPVIEFDGFARSVMGAYGSERKIKNLKTEAEKEAAREQIKRFADLFKQGLVDTYAKSLLKFNGEKIETLPLGKGEDIKKGVVSVQQKIHGSAAKPYAIQYTLKQKKGQWKVANVIIEGINLGQTYRTQFSESADKNRGDLEKVITGWQVAPAINAAKTANSEKSP
jgi:phospholipid transport system substrate-binding protein